MDEKYIDLILKLKDKTLNNKVTWNQGSRESEFSVSLENGVIVIDNWEDSNDIEFFDLKIINKDGVKVYYEPFNRRDSQAFDLVKSLYRAAFEKFYRTDETINGFLTEIDSKDTIGKEQVPPDVPD